MAQAQVKTAASASSDKKAAPAPVGGSGSAAPAASAEKAAPAAKQDRRTVSGPAYDRLVGHGASIVVLPGAKGKLVSTVLSSLGAAMSAADLPAKVSSLTKNWGQFDRGYLTGPSASYSACAVNNGSKKAKGTPAFVWAAKGKDGVSLFTADGQPWARPAKGDREQGVFDAALKAAEAALA